MLASACRSLLLLALLSGCSLPSATLRESAAGRIDVRVRLRRPESPFALQQLQAQDQIAEVRYTLIQCASAASCESSDPLSGGVTAASKTLYCFPCDTAPYDYYGAPGVSFDLQGLLPNRFYSVRVVVLGHRSPSVAMITLASGFPDLINGQRGYVSTDASGRIATHNSLPANQLNLALTAVP